MHVEFFLDYLSPYAYLAYKQLKCLNTTIVYRPVDILAIMRRVNNRPTFDCLPKLQYAGIDTVRCAGYLGIPFSPNQALTRTLLEGHLPVNLLAYAGLAAQELGVFDSINEALFDAVWAGDDDLASEEGRECFLRGHPPEAADLWNVARSQAVQDRMAEECQAAVGRGVFGVPTLMVNDEMFFGHDRMEFVRRALVSGDQAAGNRISRVREHLVGTAK
jgi:2-hydroxychromene-2-carboxylate isomerase